jgi:Pyruvate/2-oxoacid:ferredoxin oxidoreductase gamma subunit
MVMTGAYARITQLVGLDSLKAAVAACLPSYRAKHVELNLQALEAGWEVAA